MLTEKHLAVLAHVVLDPDAWYAHAVETLGEEKGLGALEAKVARWKVQYEAAKAKEGANYKTRAEREAA